MKKIIFILITILFLSNCEYFNFLSYEEWLGRESSSGGSGGGDNEETPAKLYTIGDIGPSGVGIVFYITDGGLHGLEAAPSDQSTSQVWIEGGSTQVTFNGNTSTAIGTGLANSIAIIAQTEHTGSAALLCRNYNGGGLTDWFLPSLGELNQLYIQKDTVGGFAAVYYWCSSEYDGNEAWQRNFDTGAQNTAGKVGVKNVRAVRAF